MSTWRIQRQLFFGFLFIAIIGLPIGLFVFFSGPGPSCFDGKQNQNELGIDCGGDCARACDEQVADLLIEWERIFPVRDNEYYLAARVTNPNRDFEAQNFSYTFEVFDASNQKVFEEEGVDRALPQEDFIIFEGGIVIENAQPPLRAFLVIDEENVSWQQEPFKLSPRILVRDETLSLSGSPQLTGTIVNDSTTDFDRLEITSLIFNEEDTVVGVGKTFVESLPEDDVQSIFFTWPEEFAEEPRICVQPLETVLTFDRSGSMNDDGRDPEEPITSAKNAARTFVNQLSSRDTIGLVSFATTASDPADQALTNNHDDVKQAIEAIEILPEDETGSTNVGDAIKQSVAVLDESTNAEAEKVIIILTDGKANAPSVEGGEPYAESQISFAKAKGYQVYTIGLGEEVNQTFLRSLATTPENYFFSATKEELARVYTTIAQDVCPERVFLTDFFIRPADGTF